MTLRDFVHTMEQKKLNMKAIAEAVKNHCYCVDGEINPMCTCNDFRYEKLGEVIEQHPIASAFPVR